jgi:uncharacterized protein YlxW (UPF0749 family)
MNPFVSRFTTNNWILPVTALSFVLGFMMTVAWITKDTQPSRLSFLTPDQKIRIDQGQSSLTKELQKVSTEVGKLREEKTKLENAVASQTNSTKVLNDSLQEAKLLAGLTDVEGPGITVTLKDSAVQPGPGLSSDNANIHDYDVLRVVNELWSSGAEAISVNNHRVVARSNYRCVGSVINVDGVPIAPPVIIQAIGDSKTLYGGINIRLGVLDEIRSGDPNMVSVTRFERTRLSAYAGSTTFRYVKIPKETK